MDVYRIGSATWVLALDHVNLTVASALPCLGVGALVNGQWRSPASGTLQTLEHFDVATSDTSWVAADDQNRAGRRDGNRGSR